MTVCYQKHSLAFDFRRITWKNPQTGVEDSYDYLESPATPADEARAVPMAGIGGMTQPLEAPIDILLTPLFGRENVHRISSQAFLVETQNRRRAVLKSDGMVSGLYTFETLNGGDLNSGIVHLKL